MATTQYHNLVGNVLNTLRQRKREQIGVPKNRVSYTTFISPYLQVRDGDKDVRQSLNSHKFVTITGRDKHTYPGSQAISPIQKNTILHITNHNYIKCSKCLATIHTCLRRPTQPIVVKRSKFFSIYFILSVASKPGAEDHPRH